MTHPDSSVRVSDLAAWAIRTYTPIAVVAILGWVAAHWHLVLGDKTSATVTIGAVGLVLAVYVSVARWLERRWGNSRTAGVARWLGRWMLGGVIRQPVYIKPDEQIKIRVIPGADGNTPPTW
jgi:hypothetical protein